MEAQFTSPSASLTATGVCHSIGGHPSAGEVSLDNGQPVSHFTLGYLETGQPIAVASPSLEYLDELEHAVRLERARLSMWNTDHAMHPFGDAA